MGSVLSNRRDIRPYSTDSIRPPYRKTTKVSLLNVPVRAVFLLMLCIFASVQAAPVNRSAEESTMMASQQVFNNIQQHMNNLFSSMSQQQPGNVRMTQSSRSRSRSSGGLSASASMSS